MLCVFAAFAILMLRLFYLQVIEGEEFRRLSENNCIRLKSLEAPRGLIYDRGKDLLVDNRPSFDLNIILSDAKPVEGTIQKLARYTKIPEEDFWERIARNKKHLSYKPLLLKQDIGRDALAAIEAHRFDLPGVFVEVNPRRNYIHPQSAAHLLGYLGEINGEELRSGKYEGARAGDYIGKFGVEKTFENFLRGKRGGQQVEVNATGQVVRVLKTVEAVPGHNILLTIDQTLQQKAEDLMRDSAGAVVAMDPSNGHILAIVSSPSFDQNMFISGLTPEQWDALNSNPQRPMENKAVQGQYPPASTYKMITAIAGLEEGVIDEETTFFCPGHYRFGDRVFRCWKRGGHGNVDTVHALAESCDVFFYQVGQKLGIDRLAWYATACGLGSRTGINLDYEASGLIPTASWKLKRLGVPWQRGETLSVAIGQGYNLATPIQMLVLTAAVANGGVLKKPLIMKSIEKVTGETVMTSEGEDLGRLPISEKNLGIVRQGLWEVVNERYGTAWIARVKGLDICGKTGTAQVVSRKKGEEGAKDEEIADELKPHAWFVAYAPAKEPRIAVAVVVEHGEHGSSAGGPIARELIKLYLGQVPEKGA